MLTTIKSSLFSPLFKKIEKDPKIIVWMDGGFASQIYRYTIGDFFRKKGIEVAYDTSWYEYNGKDNRGVDKRELVLPKCFPKLNFATVSIKELKRYQKYYSVSDKYVGKEQSIEAPAYLGGYSFDYLFSKVDGYEKIFDWDGIYSILNYDSKRIADEISKNNHAGVCTIGIHVRRGDMAFPGGYWKVLTEHYFAEVLSMINENNKVLYFFSNGFDFVENNILPILDSDSKYRLVKGNRDYEDMYLFSLCKIQIGSQSSWGDISFPFNKNENKVLFRPSTASGIVQKDLGKIISVKLTDEMYIHDDKVI